MPHARPLAGAVLALAITAALALPAQAALAAPAAYPVDGLLGHLVTVSRTAPSTDPAPSSSSTADATRYSATQVRDDSAQGSEDSAPVDETVPADDSSAADDGADQDVQVVDPVGDDESDGTDDSATTASPAHTSGHWAAVAKPTVAKARLTAFDRVKVTWKAGTRGVAVSRFTVQLRSGGTTMRATTSAAARSTTFWNLPSGKRWALSVTATGTDGSKAVMKGASLRTPSAAAAVKATEQAAARAKAAARHAKALSLLQ